jgi:hypothetical protein
MNIRPVVPFIKKNIPIFATIAFLVMILIRMISGHYNIELISGRLDQGARPNLSSDSCSPTMETSVDSGILEWFVGDVAGYWIVRFVRAEFLDGCFWREEEDADADVISCPDHRLDVEGWPAIGCHADELWWELVRGYKSLVDGLEHTFTLSVTFFKYMSLQHPSAQYGTKGPRILAFNSINFL